MSLNTDLLDPPALIDTLRASIVFERARRAIEVQVCGADVQALVDELARERDENRLLRLQLRQLERIVDEMPAMAGWDDPCWDAERWGTK